MLKLIKRRMPKTGGRMSKLVQLIQVVETIFCTTTANRPPRDKVLKKTMIRKKRHTTIQILCNTIQG